MLLEIRIDDAGDQYVTNRATIVELLFSGSWDNLEIAFVGGRLNGRPCTLQSIQREDGSGRCFNLTVMTRGGKVETVFCRVVRG